MWPIFIGVQVAKTVLLAMFLPSIIGSIGKMVGKGKAISNAQLAVHFIGNKKNMFLYFRLGIGVWFRAPDWNRWRFRIQR